MITTDKYSTCETAITRSHNPTIGCAGSRQTDRKTSDDTVNTTVARIAPAGRTSYG
jgi:hypothetical protein